MISGCLTLEVLLRKEDLIRFLKSLISVSTSREIEMQLNFYRRQRQLLEKPECVREQMTPMSEEEYRKRLKIIETCLSN